MYKTDIIPAASFRASFRPEHENTERTILPASRY